MIKETLLPFAMLFEEPTPAAIPDSLDLFYDEETGLSYIQTPDGENIPYITNTQKHFDVQLTTKAMGETSTGTIATTETRVRTDTVTTETKVRSDCGYTIQGNRTEMGTITEVRAETADDPRYYL